MLTRNRLLGGAAALVAASLALPVLAQESIKIGEMNSYKVFSAFLDPYKKGMELAVDEVNAAGGVLGRKIEIVSRDDNGNPADAVRVGEELLTREKVAFLIGTFPSNVGLAVADFAKQKKTLFIAAEPLTDKIVWDNGNAYTFRLRTSTYMQTAMLIPDAAKLKKKRWAIVYPNYEYGTSATAAFKKLLKEKQPDVEFVAEQAAPLGKIDAGAVAQALADAKPDAIFSSPVRPRSSRSSCVKARQRGRCSRASRCSTCWAASRNISIRLRTRRRSAGTSRAIPGTASPRPSIRSSSTPIRRSSRTTRGWARSSATRQ